MVLVQMKHGGMGIGFTRKNLVFWVMEKGLHNLRRWIITQSKGFMRKDIEKGSRSVWGHVYLVLTSHVQARSSIVGTSVSAVDAQVLKSTFPSLINKDYSIGVDIDRCQSVLEHA